MAKSNNVETNLEKDFSKAKRVDKSTGFKRSLSEITRQHIDGNFELIEEGRYIVKITDFSVEQNSNAVRFELTLEDGRVHYEYLFLWNHDGTFQNKYIKQLYDFMDAALQRRVDNLSEELMRKCIGHYLVVTIYHDTRKSGRTFERIDYNFIGSADSYDDIEDLTQEGTSDSDSNTEEEDESDLFDEED